MHRPLSAGLAALLLAACAITPAPAPPADAPADALAVAPGPGRADDALYRALGGTEGIARVVDAVLAEVAADLRINLLFAEADLPYLRVRLIEQICEASGGPCTFTGLPMDEAHTGQDISEDEFGYFVEDLVRGMTRVGVPAETQQALAALLLPMKPDIVHR